MPIRRFRSLSPSDSASERPSKRFRSGSTESEWDGHTNCKLKVFIVQPKLDEETITHLYHLVDAHAPDSHNDGTERLELELCNDIKDADVIITGIRMRRRLERHVDWNIARQKSLVTPDWLLESVKQDRPAPCGRFAAVNELHAETTEHCPDAEHECAARKDSPPGLPSPPSSTASQMPATTKPTSQRIKDNWRSRYACTRTSPLVCPNQGLVVALDVLARDRELEGLSANSLAYERAVAILKCGLAYPYVITRELFERDVVKLPGIGSKVRSKIEEYLDTGQIEESESTRSSEKYQSLNLFASIYGVGPSTARHLYSLGLRTMEDLERYYDVPVGVDPSMLDEPQPQFTPNGVPVPTKYLSKKSDSKIPPISMKVALALRRDFAIPIPRSEVEEMHNIIMGELNEIQPGCVSTIVGGYRRGKEKSNDVDIVISYPDYNKGAGIIKGLCGRFAKKLHERGLVTHVMHLSGFHAHNPLRVQHWDNLEKALTVFRFPESKDKKGKGTKQQKRLYRRLDLIFAPPEAYWTAVIGWSGSKTFERDLRLWAKVEKGMKFDSSGLTRRHDSKHFVPRSEEEVFNMLGLEWIEPTLRNANV